MIRILLLCLVLSSAFANLGIDFSVYQGSLEASTFQCFVSQGVQFMLMQIWQENNQVNPYYQGNYENAKNAGIQYVDAYVSLCPATASASSICQGVFANLPMGFSGQVWLGVEPYQGCWGSDPLGALTTVVDECRSTGLNLGIYSSGGAWAQLFGSTEASAGTISSLPLWYAHYDSMQTLDDWPHVSFGGFAKANIKQYEADDTLCGVDVDLDFY